MKEEIEKLRKELASLTPEEQMDKIIAATAGLADAHNTQRAVQELFGMKVLIKAIKDFNEKSSFLAKIMIGVALLQIIIAISPHIPKIIAFFQSLSCK